MTSDFLTRAEIEEVGFAGIGEGAQISRRAALFGPERMVIGPQTRIDAFCVLSAAPGGLRIGRNVHVSAHATILGRATVDIGDFCTLSVRCSIFSSNDDFSGIGMTNPTVPNEYRRPVDAAVRMGDHVIVGCGSVILCGVTIGRSAAIGALSLVKADVPPLAIVAGSPARRVGTRGIEHIEVCRTFLG